MIDVGLLLLTAVCFGLGGVAVWFAATKLKLWWAMHWWPKAEATIVGHATDSDDDSVHPYLVVRYQVNGRSVKTDCKSPTRTGYSLEGGGQLSKTLQRWFARYPVGSTVTVRVNLTEAKEAYTHFPNVFLLVAIGSFGVFVMAVPVFVILAALGYTRAEY